MNPESKQIVRHQVELHRYARLAGLHRYARLLTGDTNDGDALVVATLQSLAKKSDEGQPDIDLIVRNYRELTRHWRQQIATDQAHLKGSTPASGRVNGTGSWPNEMAPIARAAFLLIAVEEFSKTAAAAILDASQPELDAMINEAYVSVSRQTPTDVLIIEDELLIAFGLEDLMIKLGHRITSVVRTKRLAIKHAKLRRPRLILADINLADGSNGIEAVNEILGESDVPVIFVTAYPERLLTGSRPEPAFVISKPFKPEEIQAVVGQALFFDLKARSGLPGEVMASELVAGRMGDQI